jgi:hypothetical protein
VLWSGKSSPAVMQILAELTVVRKNCVGHKFAASTFE